MAEQQTLAWGDMDFSGVEQLYEKTAPAENKGGGVPDGNYFGRIDKFEIKKNDYGPYVQVTYKLRETSDGEEIGQCAKFHSIFGGDWQQENLARFKADMLTHGVELPARLQDLDPRDVLDREALVTVKTSKKNNKQTVYVNKGIAGDDSFTPPASGATAVWQ